MPILFVPVRLLLLLLLLLTTAPRIRVNHRFVIYSRLGVNRPLDRWRFLLASFGSLSLLDHRLSLRWLERGFIQSVTRAGRRCPVFWTRFSFSGFLCHTSPGCFRTRMLTQSELSTASRPPRRSLVPDKVPATHVPPAPGQLTGEALAVSSFGRINP